MTAELYWPVCLTSDSAEVAELADAQASGACGLRLVGVQIPPSAPAFQSATEAHFPDLFSGNANTKSVLLPLEVVSSGVSRRKLVPCVNPPLPIARY